MNLQKILMKENRKMFENRRSERLNYMISCKTYMKHEVVSGNRKIFVFGFKHIKQVKSINISREGVQHTS